MRATKVTMVALYLVMAATVGIVLGSRNVPTYWQLLQSGRSTDAAVLRTNCANHGSVFYRFQAEGREYEDFGNAGFGAAECDKLNPVIASWSITCQLTPTSIAQARSKNAGSTSWHSSPWRSRSCRLFSSIQSGVTCHAIFLKF
jgi:hypothetical protein